MGSLVRMRSTAFYFGAEISEIHETGTKKIQDLKGLQPVL